MLPLADVRVLAIEQFGAGPWGTLQLADLGAEVIKIEDPASGGDVGRYVPPFHEGEDSLFFETFNRNKKSVSLDLRHPDARARVRGPRPRLGRRLLEPARRPAARSSGSPTSDLEARQPADRLLLALGLRDDRAARGRGRLRLHDAGARRLDEPDRRPGRAADEERPLARRPLRRLRRRRSRCSRVSGARGATASAATATSRSSRPRCTSCCYVGTWAASRGYVPPRRAQLGPPLDRAVPELRDGRRLDRRRVPEAEVLGAAVRGDRPARAGRPTSASPTSPAATATATSCCRSSTRRSPSGRATEWLDVLAGAGVPVARRSTTSRRRSTTRRSRRAAASSRTSTRGSGRSARSRRRCALGRRSRRSAAAPFRGEHTEAVLVELCGYSAERVRELAEAGVFGDLTKGAINAETGVSA